jgi:hypothetical protein
LFPLTGDHSLTSSNKSHALILLVFAFLMLASPVVAEVNILKDEGKILITNGSSWVKINPISDHIVGDTFNLTGTTNLPVQSPFEGSLYTFFLCHMSNCSQDAIASHGNMSNGNVQMGGITNRISLQFNTEKFISSDDFVLSLYSPSINDIFITHVLMFPAESRKKINSLIPSSPSDDRYWLLIDSLDSTSKSLGEGPVKTSNFQVTGITNLPEGERIPYSILSSDGFYPPNSTNQIITFAGYSGEIVRGERNNISNFIVDVDASQACDGRSYWVVLWNPRYNATLPGDFMSTSMTFRCNKTTLNTSATFPLSTSSTPYQTPTPAKSPLSGAGTCIAVIIVGLFTVVKKRETSR